MLPPGSTIGMLGAGQLGRMTALAAARLGYRLHVYAPDAADSPCAPVCARATVAGWDDRTALAAFAAAVDVVTLEWENVPVDTVEFLAERVPVRPGAAVLAVTRDRIAEKSFANGLGIATAPWRPASGPGDVALARDAIGPHCIVKSNQLGYDGKGQARIGPDTDIAAAWRSIGSDSCVVEGFVDFTCEVSVIVARRGDGAMAVFPTVENRHRNGILDRTLAPARVPPATAAEAERVARRLADALGVVGLLAVEMFVTKDGRVLVNEMAPRPHNSGHWTMDACATSQFEQFVRAICGLPLGSTDLLMEAEMENLIGDDVERWAAILAEPDARLHLYGKAEARPGRKMGHVNRVTPRR
ncbi:5-(carboxyamino)imidazole ribonucleotide synthase [Azospirillum halopraeferens]|uniref:5-(carboxyamino)imidazole ribonucleotide synthase n=1 Tax=Azospirillum halopraeferens TaxID=34010 RepID=UPI00040394C8|nr:5-(carboxyamino)imidazole ribonucleotide synthase [Azospirillum halopraeferens]